MRVPSESAATTTGQPAEHWRRIESKRAMFRQPQDLSYLTLDRCLRKCEGEATAKVYSDDPLRKRVCMFVHF